MVQNVGLKAANIYSLVGLGTQYVVVLEEVDGPRLLPIWIGPAEGNAIALFLSQTPFPRPVTHDLLLNILKAFQIKVSRVIITELKESTFHASIFVELNGARQEIDARPSDSIAIALRSGAPLFITDSVFEKCETLLKPISKTEVDDFKKKLADLKPHDIYKDIQPPGPEDPGK